MTKRHSEDHKKSKAHHLLTGWRYKTLVITIILSVIGYFLFTLWGGWRDVLDAIWRVGIGGILMALSLSLVNYLLRFCRWDHYLKRIGHALPFWENLRIYISGFALTTTPGKTGEALRSIFLKEHGISYRKSLGVFVAERLSDLISVMLLTLCGLWNYQAGQYLVLAVAIFLFCGIGIIQNIKWLKAIERWTKKRLPERFYHLVDFFLEMVLAFRECFTASALVYGSFLGLLAWGAEGYAFYKLLHILGADVSLMSALFVYAFSLFIGAISFLPGGLGGTEVTMWQLLLLLGVPSSTTIAVTIVIRLATLWFSVFLGLLALPKK